MKIGLQYFSSACYLKETHSPTLEVTKCAIYIQICKYSIFLAVTGGRIRQNLIGQLSISKNR